MKFENYKYIPTIRTRTSELHGIENLSVDTKDKILPFVSLSKANRTSKIKDVFNKWKCAFDKPAILGLSDSPHLQVDEYNDIISPENNFRNWTDFISHISESNNNIIPSLILNKETGKRDFVKQLQIFENEFGKTVLKINPLHKRNIAAAITAASVIKSTDNLLFILDTGQINRENQKAALDATINALNEIRTIDPSIEIVTSGSSFPRTFPLYTQDAKGMYGEIPMLEWENYHALGGDDVAIYGDYAGIHGEFYKGSFAKFVARIDYPAIAMWIFERRRQNNSTDPREPLYSEAAQAIITGESWDDSLNVWGSQIIRKAAKGELEKFGSPGKWISVRLNLHIERIIRFLEEGISIPTSNSDKGDNWDDEDIEW